MSNTPRTDTDYLAAQDSSQPLVFMANRGRQLEHELNDALAQIAEADEDCARHNLYTVEESLRAAKAIAESNGEDPASTFAAWRDRIWWLEAQKEIARLRAELAQYRRTHRWNVREDEDGALMVCKGDHEKSDGCVETRYVRLDS